MHFQHVNKDVQWWHWRTVRAIVHYEPRLGPVLYSPPPVLQLQTTKHDNFEISWSGFFWDKLTSDSDSAHQNTSKNLSPKFFPRHFRWPNFLSKNSQHLAPLLRDLSSKNRASPNLIDVITPFGSFLSCTIGSNLGFSSTTCHTGLPANVLKLSYAQNNVNLCCSVYYYYVAGTICHPCLLFLGSSLIWHNHCNA